MMTNARVNVLCKITAGRLRGAQPPPPIAKPKIRIQYVPSSARLIWQCDVINDEKRMKWE